jgi:hypothetical protein
MPKFDRREKVSHEFEIVIWCCRQSFASDGALPVSALRNAMDWSLFLSMARFHRVQGLVWNSIMQYGLDVPTGIEAALAEDTVSIAASNLHAAAESFRLLNEFENRGLSILFIKGLALGALAYGTIALKSSVDIDILIDAHQLTQASALLINSGYRLAEPSANTAMARLQRWHNFRKESVWTKADPPQQIDLHTRLADNRRLIPSIGLDSPSVRIEVAPGISLPTLARDELFSYLAVHGASSAWFRLKWITDFAALVHGDSAKEIERLYQRSQSLGAARATGQALLIAESMFGTLQLSSTLRQELLRDYPTRLLHWAALPKLAGLPREPTASAFGTLTIHWTQLLLERGFTFKLGEMLRQVKVAIW